MRSSRQLELVFPSRGGRRAGAGRKPGPGRRKVTHRKRPRHDPHLPVHVTLRARDGLPSLRVNRVWLALERTLARSSDGTFRVVHFSAQADHLHLIVEADAPTRLTSGMQGLAIRAAKAINRVLGRHGRVWSDRYHARTLATPREVRNALVYVLQNWKKHEHVADGLDPRSSARWFAGWHEGADAGASASPVPPPRTWLAHTGWQRYGLVGRDEGPRTGQRSALIRQVSATDRDPSRTP
jgi:putative transposase